MDLSFKRLEQDRSGTTIPSDLAVLLVGISARQAISPTARVETALAAAGSVDSGSLPTAGAFNPPMARLIAQWREDRQDGQE